MKLKNKSIFVTFLLVININAYAGSGGKQVDPVIQPSMIERLIEVILPQPKPAEETPNTGGSNQVHPSIQTGGGKVPPPN